MYKYGCLWYFLPWSFHQLLGLELGFILIYSKWSLSLTGNHKYSGQSGVYKPTVPRLCMMYCTDEANEAKRVLSAVAHFLVPHDNSVIFSDG